MTSLRVILVDDEQLSRDLLQNILQEIPEVEVIEQCVNGRQAVQQVSRLHPDLLLLDIQMPGMTGFDVVRAIQSDVMPMIIFATAYDQYAVDAFELNAVDYVLKPFEPERLKIAIERARQRKKEDEKAGAKDGLINALAGMDSTNTGTFSDVSSTIKKLAIKEGGETLLVPFEDIEWIDAAGDYMCVHVGNVTHVIRCTMKELEQKLDTPLMTRIHRSTLVNLEKVRSITSLPKGECQLHLDGDIILKSSRSYRENIKKLLS